MTIFLIAFCVAYLAKDSNNLTMMMGAAITMGSTVVNYWLGSSSGSAKKTDLISAQPPSIIPTPSVVRTETVTATTATPVPTPVPTPRPPPAPTGAPP